MASGKGSSSVINYMHHFFSNFGLGETAVDLHCDNCSGQNKNRFVLWYMARRTIHSLHKEITLNFLITGHTKFAPDWCFGLVKQTYRRTRVCKLADIADVVANSTVTGVNIPQIVGREDGTVLVTSYDWQKFLEPYFRPFPGVKSFQHLSFDSANPGQVTAKQYCDSVTKTTFQLLKDPAVLPPAHMPLTVSPPGIDLKRQIYLYDHIREFCDDSSVDICCPKPKETANQPKSKETANQPKETATKPKPKETATKPKRQRKM